MDLDLIVCIFLDILFQIFFLGNFINHSRQVFYSSLPKGYSNVTRFSARVYFRDFGYPFLDVHYTCRQM